MNNQIKSNIKTPVVVGIGEILWDMLPSGRQLGGAPTNFAWFAKTLGAESYVVSSVGSDSLGRDILARLDKMKISREYISVDRDHPTGVVDVQLDKDGKPAYDIRRDVAWDFIRFSPELHSLARRTRAVCFGSLAQRSAVSRRTIRKFVSLMPASALKVFDVNLRQSFYNRNIIHDLLKLSNVFKLNDDELVIVADMLSVSGNEANVVKSLMRRYQLDVVALTRGGEGSVLYCADGKCVVKGQKIKIVDTVGAGDSFASALAVGLVNGVKTEKIIELANRLAAYVCGRHGATPILSGSMKKAMGVLCRRTSRKII